MTKKKLPVRFTGQHFTIDKVLIKDAIRQANISWALENYQVIMRNRKRV